MKLLFLPTLILCLFSSFVSACEPEGPPREALLVSGSSLRFGLSLYRELSAADKDKNLFFSPYSVSLALGMATEGARGETALELGRALGYPKDTRNASPASPWDLSTLRAGFQSIAGIFAEDDAAELKGKKAEIASLRRELASLQSETAALQKRKQWKAYHEKANEERKIVQKLNPLLKELDRFELNIANAFWGAKGGGFSPGFKSTLSDSYDSSLFELDFSRDPEAARKHINDWVAERTRERILDLLPGGSVTPLTRLVLTNAVYFKGEWDSPFEEKNTKPRDFNLASGETIQVDTLRQKGMRNVRYGAFETGGTPFETPRRFEKGQTTGLYPAKGGFTLLELPYKGNELSMVFVVPRQSHDLDAIEAKLDSESLTRWIRQLDRRKTHVSIPKLKLETSYDLKKSLSATGIVSAFDPGRADFSGMLSSGEREDVYIGKVIHKAFLRVDEKGTEAAAATAVIFPEASAPPKKTFPFTPEFRADRPYVFLIRERSTGLVLFLGRVLDPR